MSGSAIPAGARDGAPRLGADGVAKMRSELADGWCLALGPERLERVVSVVDFAAALAIVNGIGEFAEQENHHPDLAITEYRNVSISLTTHDAGGLTANDFVLARRFDALVQQS